MTVAWRVVRCLTTLRLEVNAAYPGRATGADGTIGDASHIAEGSASDHNPHLYPALGPTAVVCALDITHDPAHGCDTYAMAEAMRQARDPRVGYIISNRRITGPNHGWKWDGYTGTSDPHTGHVHVSSVHTALADNENPWHFTPSAVLTGAKTGDDMAAADDTLALLRRALNGFSDHGMPTENLLGTWIGDLQHSQGTQTAQLAAIATTLAAQTQTITNLTALLQQAGSPDVAPLVQQIQAMTTQIGRLAETEAAQTAQIAALQAKLAAAAKAEADTLTAP